MNKKIGIIVGSIIGILSIFFLIIILLNQNTSKDISKNIEQENVENQSNVEENNVEVVEEKTNEIVLNSKIGTKRNVTYEVEIDDIKAPVKVGDIVGKINVIEDGKTIMEVDVTVINNIKKANIFKAYIRNLTDIFKGTI